jgi:molybdenum cofactor cytidylyltransferase
MTRQGWRAHSRLALPARPGLAWGVEPADCVIPAGGRSQRMGEWKPMLPFGGSTIVARVVSTALLVCPRVILVAGYRGEELQGLFAGEPRVAVIVNKHWELGMFSSIRCGAARVETGRFFICLADMPYITAAAYAALLASAQRAGLPAARTEAVIPVFQGRRGHPVLAGSTVREAIHEADPAAGNMREILRGFTVTEVPWGDDTILRDIDTREDYER